MDRGRGQRRSSVGSTTPGYPSFAPQEPSPSPAGRPRTQSFAGRPRTLSTGYRPVSPNLGPSQTYSPAYAPAYPDPSRRLPAPRTSSYGAAEPYSEPSVAQPESRRGLSTLTLPPLSTITGIPSSIPSLPRRGSSGSGPMGAPYGMDRPSSYQPQPSTTPLFRPTSPALRPPVRSNTPPGPFASPPGYLAPTTSRPPPREIEAGDPLGTARQRRYQPRHHPTPDQEARLWHAYRERGGVIGKRSSEELGQQLGPGGEWVRNWFRNRRAGEKSEMRRRVQAEAGWEPGMCAVHCLLPHALHAHRPRDAGRTPRCALVTAPKPSGIARVRRRQGKEKAALESLCRSTRMPCMIPSHDFGIRRGFVLECSRILSDAVRRWSRYSGIRFLPPGVTNSV